MNTIIRVSSSSSFKHFDGHEIEIIKTELSVYEYVKSLFVKNKLSQKEIQKELDGVWYDSVGFGTLKCDENSEKVVMKNEEDVKLICDIVNGVINDTSRAV